MSIARFTLELLSLNSEGEVVFEESVATLQGACRHDSAEIEGALLRAIMLSVARGSHPERRKALVQMMEIAVMDVNNSEVPR